MKDFYEFAGNHPILTFFLFGILSNCVIALVRGRLCKACRRALK